MDKQEMNTNRANKVTVAGSVAPNDGGAGDMRKDHLEGFTLIELLVVIAIIAILASILMPVLNAAEKKALSAECLSNERQLTLAWITYAGDNHDVLVPNGDLGAQPASWGENPLNDTSLQSGGSLAQWCPGNVQQTPCALNYQKWIESGLLFSYNQNLGIYKCPADRSQVPRGSSVVKYSALRTYSMNCWVQPMNQAGTQGTPWNNIHGYDIYTKFSNMLHPGPSQTWIFIEESPSYIDDGFFASDPITPTQWYEIPALLHGRSSNMSYADGHVEGRLWTDGNMINAANNPTYVGQDVTLTASTTSGDLAWFLSRCTAPSQ